MSCRRLLSSRVFCRSSAISSRAPVVFALLFFALPVEAAGLARAVRRAADVADDVPVRRLDEVVEKSGRSRAGREVLERLSASKRLDDPVQHAAAVRRAFREVMGGADGAMLKEIETLPRATQQGLLVVANGGRRIKSVVPDIAQRSRLVREGGAETLAALGRHEDLADDLLRFDTALKANKLPSLPGQRPLTVGDFGDFFHTLGDRGHHFWKHYVRPHWKLWLGGMALGAVLFAPEEFLDSIGNLTHEGLRKVTAFGGKVLGDALAGVARGLVEGTGGGVRRVLDETLEAMRRTFFTSLSGVVSACLIVLAVILVLRPVRRAVVSAVTVLSSPVVSWYKNRTSHRSGERRI